MPTEHKIYDSVPNVPHDHDLSSWLLYLVSQIQGLGLAHLLFLIEVYYLFLLSALINTKGACPSGKGVDPWLQTPNALLFLFFLFFSFILLFTLHFYLFSFHVNFISFIIFFLIQHFCKYTSTKYNVLFYPLFILFFHHFNWTFLFLGLIMVDDTIVHGTWF